MKKYLKYLLCAIFLLAIICAAASCKKIKQLATPEDLRIEDEILSWTPVENASEYLIEANDLLFQTKEHCFDLLETILQADTYTIRVTALGDLEKYSDSERSAGVKYEVRPWKDILSCTKDKNNIVTVKASKKSAVAGKLVIPEFVNEYMVTSIAEDAFRDCENLTSVYIPDTITEINESAFRNCTGLTRVRFPKTVSAFEAYCFNNCGFTELRIPECMQEIGDSNPLLDFLSDCKALKKLIFPSNYTKFVHAIHFKGCNSLEYLEVEDGNPEYRSENNCIIRKSDNMVVAGCKTSVIPESAQEISFNAFSFCEGLTEIFIPAGVTRIKFGSFIGTISLSKIEVAEDNSVYRSEGNCVIRKEDNVLMFGCKTSIIPNWVTTIGDGAFNRCTGLTEINIPDSVTEIRATAFYKCSNLKRVKLPEKLKEIGRSAFEDCGNLDNVIIPNSVNTIEQWAFAGCHTTITVASENLQTLGLDALDGNFVYTGVKRDSLFALYYMGIVVHGCELAYDGTYPYVVSLEWKKKYGKLPFDGNGAFIPTRIGFEFVGWSTSPDGEAIYLPRVALTNMYSTATGDKKIIYTGVKTVTFYGEDFNSFPIDTVLYAVWRPVS